MLNRRYSLLSKATDREIQDCALHLNLHKFDEAFYRFIQGPKLPRQGRRELLSEMKLMEYTLIDRSDPDWLVPAKKRAALKITHEYKGSQMLSRFIWSLKALFGTKGYMVDDLGDIGVLVANVPQSINALKDRMKRVAKHARVRVLKPKLDEQDGTTIFRYAFDYGTKGVQIKLEVQPVIDVYGPALYISWDEV